MKKIFTLAAAVLASFSLWAQTEIFSFTVTSATTAMGTYPANGGSAVLSGSAHSTGGSNEITVDAQTYYKFNSSTKWTFTLSNSETFADGDVISLRGASNASSDKTGKGFKLAGSIVLTGNFPKNTANTLTYTIVSGDGIAGQSSFTLERNDSDIKFGTITITRPAAETNPVAEVTIEGPETGVKDMEANFSATTDVKADAYQWYVNGVAQNEAIGKAFAYTPDATGNYTIVCKARNANNATDEWAADTVAFKVFSAACGEIIKATLTSGTAATVTGVIGGTADVSLSSSKKMDKGKYFGITLANGTFQKGDTVVITMTTAGGNYPCLFGDKDRNILLYLATEGSSDLEYRIILPEAANTLSSLYLARDADDANYKWNPVLSSIAVIRPMAIKSTVESLTAVSINGTALAEGDFAELETSHTLILTNSYVDAPVVKFTKHVVITYEDDSVKETDEEVSVTSQQATAGQWGAFADINGVAYSVYTAKASSFTVHYMDGETELGTENVAANGTVQNYANYQFKNLHSFAGWFQDVDLSIEAILTDPITTETYLYAKFEKAYAQSINFEKAVMENGKAYAIINQLGTLGYSTNIAGSLDSLDNSKADGLRNYAYLGLKVKQIGALLNFNLAAGNTVTIKFGNIAKTPNVSINNGEYADMEITDNVYTHTAGEADELISIKMMDGNSVVFQQIMIGEALQAPELFAINCAEAENGTIAAQYKLGIPDEEIALTVTPAEGYKATAVALNGEAILPIEDAYSFNMPAAVANITAEFGIATGIENAEAEIKAVKIIRDGQVLILRDGKFFNALGAEVK